MVIRNPLLFFIFLIDRLAFTIFFSPKTIISARALSFNFTSFDSSNNNITYDRAYAANQAIQLTGGNIASLGQATYSQPLHLWDSSSKNLTDFTTHFSFVIDSQNRTTYGDGLAFFFAPEGKRLDSNITKGGGLGLATDQEQLNSTDNPFFAVEFDIYKNSWDPPREHVGIDLSSMQSTANTTWFSDIRDGRKNEAWISYNSSTHNLSVTYTGFVNNNTVLQHLNAVVDLRQYLPEFVTFGFSAATGNQSAIHAIYSWDFSSSDLILTSLGSEKRKGNKIALVVGLSVGGSVLVGFLALACLSLWRRSKSGGEDDDVFEEFMDDEFRKGTGPKRFSYNELAQATNHFRDDQKLGQGGFGGVYRGELRDDSNHYVAVKKISKNSTQGVKEYASEIKVISRLRHRNLVQLIGWCHQKKELLLVYEYMSNGSLDKHLFKEGNSLLKWDLRYKIVQGLASALLYLHEEWEQCVVHRDIKSSNVMLDSSFNAKLGDFGLARLVDHAKGSQTTVLAGTMGYMAPESVMTGRASKESDVYSFGVVALEIACGRKPINPKAREDEIVLVEWVWQLYSMGNLLMASDPKLSQDYNEEQMKCLMIVGLWCAQPDVSVRPSIRQALKVLNFEAPLPILSSNRAVATYQSFSRIRQASSFLLSADSTNSEQGQTQNSSSGFTTVSSQATSASTPSSSSTTSLLHPL